MTPDEIEALKPYLIMPSDPDRTGRIWSYCPAHPDGTQHGRRPAAGSNLYGRSLSLHPRFGLTCFSGCSFADIMAAFRERGYSHNGRRGGKREPVRIYRYCNADGTLVAEKGRFEPGFGGRPKSFAWRMPGTNTWSGISSITVPLPLYGSERIPGTDPSVPVYIVEGEKAAEACWEHGLLAVSPPNGANGAFRLGHAVDVLRDRIVYLWPDNDDVGRRFMQQLAGVLRPICRSIGYVAVPVPPKGDAYDYFALGYTAEDIHRSVAGDTPYAVVTAPGEYTCVYRRTPDGTPVTVTADSMQFGRDAVEAIVRVDTGTPPQYRQRINLISLSSRQAMARELKEMYGDRGWARILSESFSAIIDTARASSTAIDIAKVQPELAAKSDLIPGIIMEGEANLIFGHGSSGKTYAGLYFLLLRAVGGIFNGCDIQQAPILWLDYETRQDGSVVRRRISRLLEGIGLQDIPEGTFFYQPGKGVPVWDLYDQLDRIVTTEGVSVIGVDSALKACGGDIRNELSTAQYFSVLQKLGITSLTLAHVTKTEQNGDTPFGSVFWINEPHGYVWHASRNDENSTPQLHVMDLTLAKANEGAASTGHRIEIAFEDPAGPVTVDITAQADNRNTIERISSAIETNGGKILINDLARMTRIPVRAIISACRANQEVFSMKLNSSAGQLEISFAS